MQEPKELVARLAILVTQFWGGPWMRLLESCAEEIQRSLDHCRSQSYEGTARESYEALTGKRLSSPEMERKFEDTEKVIFVPSCYTGPYAQIFRAADDKATLIVIFNCRSGGQRADATSEIIRHIFPPLKALADETRLQILGLLQRGELYAQQIVDQLDLSQSSVSRHLSLLVASGVLSARKENGMKFYRINEPSMERFLEQLHRITREGGSD
jgi:DNA-binding transcriptional ArsR family regulator